MVLELWLMGVLIGVSGATHVLQGSEGYPEEKIFGFHQHKPLPSHYIAPYLHHLWAQKLAAISYIKHLKPTITKTKTVVMQTVRHERKHLMCYKAPHDLPPCLHDSKEDSFILPTSVPEIPQERLNTQFLGYLEGSELKQDTELNQEFDLEELDREQRHLFGKGLFKSIKYVTKTLWVTRVEDYVDTQVTATLLAANCIPCHANIKPCPEKVEHYVHYDLSHESKPVYEEGHSHKHHYKKYEHDRENDKEFSIEERVGEEERRMGKSIIENEQQVLKNKTAEI